MPTTKHKHPVLTLRELNRTLLSRQMLLERENLSVSTAVSKLVGLQAQVSREPYIGLWTRLANFRREDLTKSLEQREVGRVAFQRSTLHLITADDFLTLRHALQPALSRALSAFFGNRARVLNIPLLLEAARPYFEEKPRTFAELRAHLIALEPDKDPEAMAYGVRTFIPLVQVPGGNNWGYPTNPAYALVQQWFGREIEETDNLRQLILRYLAAFGPASLKDIQAWSGLTTLKPVVEALRPELAIFQDEKGNELFDLPDAPHLAADTPAPFRFLPEYDNLILSHSDRSRIIANEFRSYVYLSAGRVRSTFLQDGFVAGTWKIARTPKITTLTIEPFKPLSAEARTALIEEGEKLTRFVDNEAKEVEIKVADTP